jgi:CheY-like chemotaxis protein
VQQGIRRLLFKSFEVVAVESGAAALALLEHDDDFAVVVSDMRMPNMNGAELLAEIRRLKPDLTRLLLTGHADLDAAIAAVNRGQIFRFLTKPCPPEELAAALHDAVAQHRLVTSERVLLEQTLVGSVRALSEVLALVHPAVFGPTMRQHARALALGRRLGAPHAWQIEVASMLLSVGYVVLPGEVASKLRAGETLDSAESEMAAQVPGVIERVLSHIPRLEQVRALLRSYEALRSRQTGGDEPLEARTLFAVTQLTALEARGQSTAQAIRDLRASGQHDEQLIEALLAVCQPKPPAIRALRLDEIASGMTLAADVTTKGGLLIVAHGQPVTEQLLLRVRNFHARLGVNEPILCEVPCDDDITRSPEVLRAS